MSSLCRSLEVRLLLGKSKSLGRWSSMFFRESRLFGAEMVGKHKMVWMSHGDEAARLLERFEVVARSVQGWWMRLRTHQRAGCMFLSTIRSLISLNEFMLSYENRVLDQYGMKELSGMIWLMEKAFLLLNRDLPGMKGNGFKTKWKVMGLSKLAFLNHSLHQVQTIRCLFCLDKLPYHLGLVDNYAMYIH
ncbi:uncharacterized protein LOC120264398 isoform X2 [Dioscorea cayenensis subsp. rotundata]|nr:uncharacterized protein LOC120264398 isoform X2 [Dioscorea cayenensis subsp. rotundata]